MTHKIFSMVDGKRIGIAPNLTPRLHRVDSLSILSRQSVLGLLLLILTLFMGVGQMWGTNATVGTTMWSENFSGYSANDYPDGSISNSHDGTTVYSGSVTYTCTAGTDSRPKVFDDGGSGTTVENLLIYKKNGYFTVSGIPTGGATELTLSYVCGGSGTLSITCSSNVTLSGTTISVTSGTSFDITFENTHASKNLRLDDISVVVKTAGAAPATPYTVTFYKTDGSTTSSTETSAGAGVTPPTMKNTCGDWTFQGWSKSQSNSTTSTTALSVETLSNGKYYPTAATTLYPVYTRTDTGDPVETKTQTFQYDSWTKGGSSTDKSSNSYRLFHNGGYVESASALDFSTLSKVVVYGGTFGGTEYNSISIRKADGTVWKNATVSGASQTGVNNITGGASLTGSAKLRVYSTCGTSTGSGVRISKVEIYTLETSSTTYYYSYPNCCTELGSINGSFF